LLVRGYKQRGRVTERDECAPGCLDAISPDRIFMSVTLVLYRRPQVDGVSLVTNVTLLAALYQPDRSGLLTCYV